MQDKLISKKSLQNFLGVSQPTLDRMRRKGEFPQPIRLSPKRVAWRQSDVDEWLAKGGFNA
ncbi:AlpA family phage regulatory protein [Neiella sp. HB171785]|uniref:AlpA family phage regulatory protein n=1 Tax=Neiella litorisoli TaxID=2771431 RepID=A0A8J6UPH6_9GAMM|nr:AlpA family phage regulatory protein [Neiella litorisoli]MBD1388427.1 AlpA family phage regulatory protein [Neiella litorisoli]